MGLSGGDHLYVDCVACESFSRFLAAQRSLSVWDEDIAALHCLDHGRASVPLSLLALVLQTDEERLRRVIDRVRCKVALGIGLDEWPFANDRVSSGSPLFRSRPIVLISVACCGDGPTRCSMAAWRG